MPSIVWQGRSVQGENVDVKALRAKFHAQADSSGHQASGPMTEYSTNGVVRSKVSPIVPRSAFPMNSPTEPKRLGQAPHGVFPKPPPSYRAGPKEDPKAPFAKAPENVGRVKLTGELLRTQMLKHNVEKKPQACIRPIMPSQRSVSEVPPLRKPLPPLGPRPLKPKRPPTVRLDHLRKKTSASLPQGPARPPNKPTMLSQSFSKLNVESDQDSYEDLPPPPPPPPKSSRESWTGSFSSQADEESDKSDIYEHIEDQEVVTQAAVSEKKQHKEPPRHKEQDKKELREQLKRENEYRKRFKLQLTGEVEVLHTARARTDWHGGKNDLRVRQGESVEIVRINDNPEGKWLARNMHREYGYISNTCIDVDYEAVKRRFRTEAAFSIPAPVQDDDEIYDDVVSDVLNSSHNLSNEVYDDVDHVTPDEFPLPPPEICYNLKSSKKLEKEEKEFRKKFKYEGPIKVLYCMMVDPNANIKKCGGKDLSVARGEILEVIQQTNDKKMLCRNEQGKYGYVPRSYLLQPENEVYDDIDIVKDIYDNDPSVSGPPRPGAELCWREGM